MSQLLESRDFDTFGDQESIASLDPSDRLSQAVHQVLELIGETPSREGLRETPARAAEALRFLTSGYATDPAALVNGAIFEVAAGDLVSIRDIEFFSLCEHHLLPFFGRVHVSYVPDGRVIGLSKVPRLVDMFARRLQVQERLTDQIAQALYDILRPRRVVVEIDARHCCVMMRGVQKQCSTMLTRSSRGLPIENAEGETRRS
jgi:GTP cyclohydrolase I